MKIINTGESISIKTKVWRYFRFDRFVELIKNKNIYFAAAAQFEDLFEGAVSIVPNKEKYFENFYENAADNAFKELCRLTKISCWHIEEYESDAMWKIYANHGKGIAVSTTVEKILSSIKPYRLPKALESEDLIFGKISYVNLLKDELSIGRDERFFHKHIIFNWEKEFRLAISLRMAEEFGINVPEKGIHVGVDPHELIGEIYIGPNLEKENINKCLDICKEFKFEDKIRISDSLGRPIYCNKLIG